MVDYLGYSIGFGPSSSCSLYLSLSSKSILVTRFDDLERTDGPSRYKVLGSWKCNAEQARDAKLINGHTT